MLGRSHQIPLVSRSFDDRHRHGRRESHKCCCCPVSMKLSLATYANANCSETTERQVVSVNLSFP